jgi:hypothetical protein
LLDVEPARRLGDGALLGDSNEIAQMPQFHRVSLLLIPIEYGTGIKDIFYIPIGESDVPINE